MSKPAAQPPGPTAPQPPHPRPTPPLQGGKGSQLRLPPLLLWFVSTVLQSARLGGASLDSRYSRELSRLQSLHMLDAGLISQLLADALPQDARERVVAANPQLGSPEGALVSGQAGERACAAHPRACSRPIRTLCPAGAPATLCARLRRGWEPLLAPPPPPPCAVAA